MKIVVAEKIAAAAMKVLEAIPDCTVIPPEQFASIPCSPSPMPTLSSCARPCRPTPTLIEAGRSIRVIGRAGVGVDNIDVEVATRRGIVVMNAPGASAVSVSELTLGLMLAMARHISRADHTTRAGKWEKKSLQGTELSGKTLGIIGLGSIGTETARASPRLRHEARRQRSLPVSRTRQGAWHRAGFHSTRSTPSPTTSPCTWRSPTRPPA